jgi:septum formation protein
MSELFYKNTELLLASKSPRRQQLLFDLGANVTIVSVSADETVSEDIPGSMVPELLAKRKADAYTETLKDNQILITADTLVVLDDKILGKPKSRDDAFRILSALSGRKHQVYTGVCLKTKDRMRTFTECTDVYFSSLSDEEINYYLNTYKYDDKAGAYGIQDWIGMIGVSRIEGDYYNVMGLPVARMHKEIEKIIRG